MEKWQTLGDKLGADGFKLSWQQGLKDLYEYMDWINSCDVLITHDSLGLHIALAMKKKVVALFGSTGYREVFMYHRGIVVEARSACPKKPCYQSSCSYKPFCMDGIGTGEILSALAQIGRGGTP